MISLLEVIFFSPGALFDGKIDRKKKTAKKAIKNILIFGKNASFVHRFRYEFQYPYHGKIFKISLDVR